MAELQYNLYLWTLEFIFHIILMCHKQLFFFWFFFQPLKSIKPSLGHRPYKNSQGARSQFANTALKSAPYSYSKSLLVSQINAQYVNYVSLSPVDGLWSNISGKHGICPTLNPLTCTPYWSLRNTTYAWEAQPSAKYSWETHTYTFAPSSPIPCLASSTGFSSPEVQSLHPQINSTSMPWLSPTPHDIARNRP